FAIIRRAPEVKRCLTRRLVDYMVGTGLRYDPAWLDGLAAPLVEAGRKGEGSSPALRQTVRMIALSRAFASRDPDPGVCYDRVNPASPVPCEVASILQTSCSSSCHSSTARLGGLALDSWIVAQPGDGAGKITRGQFEHRNSAGQLLSASESFARIKERVMSADPNFKMPPRQEMKPREREELYLWLDARLAETTR
ncbi:MAG: hypothetical protein RIR26_1799, partial [Pseudomonadota bacterium]